jgi:hypothetical protein
MSQLVQMPVRCNACQSQRLDGRPCNLNTCLCACHRRPALRRDNVEPWPNPAAATGCASTELVERLRHTRPPEWCRKYVGKQYQDKGRGPEKYDCWGIVLAVLKEQFGITGLPDYGDTYTTSGDWSSVSRAVIEGLKHGWNKLSFGGPEPGDLVIINLAGRPFHCGVFVAQPDWMLHALEGTDVVLEQLSRPMWAKANRIEGIYRHAGTSRNQQ